MSLGEKIQQLRKSKGISQEQLADKLNVSRQAISKWETDQSSPDIEKILAISKFFSVSTDELLGNDAAENPEYTVPPIKEARKRVIIYFNRLKELKDYIYYKKIIFAVFSLLCISAIGICAIVDVAINRRITWAAYVPVSIIFGWIIITPSIFGKYLISLFAVTVTVNPFLYLLDMITPDPSWFFMLGLPSAIVGLVFFWVTYLIFRFIKINAWYKAAIFFFLGGVAVNPMINYFADKFTKSDPSALNLIINIFSCVIVSALFWAFGYIGNKIKKNDLEVNKY